MKICVIVGSLRGIDQPPAGAGPEALPASAGHEFVHADIGTLPLYSEEQDDAPPAPVVALRDLVKASDAVMFVTPEYNRSIPGVLKNAIDHGSRPYGKGVWGGKPTAVIGTSESQLGTALAQSHLRSVLAYLDVPVLDQPEAYIRWTDKLVADDGAIAETSREFLTGWMDAFFTFAGRHAGA